MQDLFELAAEALEQVECPACALGAVLLPGELAAGALLSGGLERLAAFPRWLFALFATRLIHALLRSAA